MIINLTPELKAKLLTLPASPGVYFHKNGQGEIIYVGKAAVLKNRVRQYFHHSMKDTKTLKLVGEIRDTDWIVVETEMDALFLEAEMIKRYLPKWNILLRDDKTVNYVRINTKSEVPFVSITRQPLDDGATYIGPFYTRGAITKALRVLRRPFPYYDRPYDGKKSLYTDLGLTPGIEVGRSTKAEYKANLSHLIQYLKGGRVKLMLKLKKEMIAAAKLEEFERAAQLRNQLRSLEELRAKIIFSDLEFMDLSSDQALNSLMRLLKLSAPPRRIEGFDISHHGGTNVVASMVVFTNGVSDRPNYRKFKIKEDKNNDFANLREVIARRLKHQSWTRPDLILIDGGVPQLEAVKDLLGPTGIPFCGLAEDPDTLVLPLYHTSSEKSIEGAVVGYRHLPIATNTHVMKLLQRIRNEAHRFAITYHRLLKRKSLIGPKK